MIFSRAERNPRNSIPWMISSVSEEERFKILMRTASTVVSEATWLYLECCPVGLTKMRIKVFMQRSEIKLMLKSPSSEQDTFARIIEICSAI